MICALIFILGVGVGHYISPWIDGKIADILRDREEEDTHLQ